MLRIFSNNNDVSCNDYIKNVKGKTILSNLKTNNYNNRNVSVNDNKIISYLSYNDFLVITQTFYKFSNLKKKYKPPQKIIDLKTSFLFYNKILSHIQSCEFCRNNSVHTFFSNCKEIQKILYPYGEYFTYEIYSNLASVDLNYWCRKECINNIHCENNCGDKVEDVLSEINKCQPIQQQQPIQQKPQQPNLSSDVININAENKSNKINIHTDMKNESNLFKNSQENITIDTINNDTFNNSTYYESNNRLEFVTNSLFINKNTFNIFIAELTNSKEYTYEKISHIDFETENKHYNIYNFIPIYLNIDEFKNIFFNSNTKYFNISDVISEKIKLSNQYFKNINNQNESFIISNSIKKIYIEKNNYNEMDANTLIKIERETNEYISLYDFNYITNSLNLDEILNIIKKNNIDDGVCEIKIKIKVYYKSKKTEIPCIMYFNYIIQNIN